MINTPVVRVELDFIRRQVTQHLMHDIESINESVKLEISNALDRVDLTDIINREVDSATKRAVEHYFRQGAGWHGILDSVNEKLNGGFSNG